MPIIYCWIPLLFVLIMFVIVILLCTRIKDCPAFCPVCWVDYSPLATLNRRKQVWKMDGWITASADLQSCKKIILMVALVCAQYSFPGMDNGYNNTLLSKAPCETMSTFYMGHSECAARGWIWLKLFYRCIAYIDLKSLYVFWCVHLQVGKKENPDHWTQRTNDKQVHWEKDDIDLVPLLSYFIFIIIFIYLIILFLVYSSIRLISVV